MRMAILLLLISACQGQVTEDGSASAADASSPDTRAVDVLVADALVADARVADALVADARVADASVADAQIADARVADALVADARADDASTPPASIEISLQRAPTGTDFTVLVLVLDGTGAALSGRSVTVTSSRGSVGAVTEPSSGTYQAEVTAAGTGEYEVRASDQAAGLEIVETAVVLGAVADGWDQPLKVRGLVNTEGWEDGIFVTPDAEYLFLQYIPTTISCFWVQDSPYCDDVYGPYSAPERPDFEGAVRISGPGPDMISNACYGLPDGALPWFMPPCSYYGFRRQADGSYAEPFQLYIADSGGCLCPVGLNAYLRPGDQARLLFGMWETQGGGTENEFWIADDIPLGQDVALGRWSGVFGSGGDVLDRLYARVPIPHAAGRLGVNAHASLDDQDELAEIYFDKEPDLEALSITRFDGADWSAPELLGAPFNVAGANLRMPHISPSGLAVFYDAQIALLPYSSGSGWSDTYEVLLSTGSGVEPDRIGALGEPSVVLDPDSGRDAIFFNYGLRRADGTYDMNVAFVVAR